MREMSVTKIANPYRRGEIWWVTLDPTVGFETKKTRPFLDESLMGETPKTALVRCLILQNDAGNKRSRLTTIAPLLSVKKLKFIVNIQPTAKNGLDKERGLHLNQIRAIDSTRVKSKLGEIDAAYWEDIHRAINIHLGFVM
jgi:mRNA interferase MazF